VQAPRRLCVFAVPFPLAHTGSHCCWMEHEVFRFPCVLPCTREDARVVPPPCGEIEKRVRSPLLTNIRCERFSGGGTASPTCPPPEIRCAALANFDLPARGRCKRLCVSASLRFPFLSYVQDYSAAGECMKFSVSLLFSLHQGRQTASLAWPEYSCVCFALSAFAVRSGRVMTASGVEMETCTPYRVFCQPFWLCVAVFRAVPDRMLHVTSARPISLHVTREITPRADYSCKHPRAEAPQCLAKVRAPAGSALGP
jgi:hypothetical protein